jgi:hypothetical protein
VAELALEPGLGAASVLESADPGYVLVRWLPTGSPPPTQGTVESVTGAARRAAGAWPSPDALLVKLIEGLNEAADAESEPEKKGLIRQTADVMGGIARQVATSVIAGQIGAEL